MTEATGPLTIDQAADLLVQPEAEAEEAEVVEEATQSDEADVDQEEDNAPDEDADDAEPEGEEDEDDEEDAEDEAPETLHTVTVDGETKRVTLDELKRGYSGQDFIQKGMKANAEARKLLTAEAHNLQQQRDQLERLLQAQQEGGLTPPTPPDDGMIETDPIGYMEARAKYEANMVKFQQNVSQLEYQRQVAWQQSEQQRQARMAEQAEAVKAAIPEIANPETGGKVLAALKSTGEGYGFSAAEIASLDDARMVRVLNDARKWNELQASKAKAEKKAEGARPVIKPGTKARPESKKRARDKQRAKLKQSGRIDDAVALILNT